MFEKTLDLAIIDKVKGSETIFPFFLGALPPFAPLIPPTLRGPAGGVKNLGRFFLLFV